MKLILNFLDCTWKKCFFLLKKSIFKNRELCQYFFQNVLDIIQQKSSLIDSKMNYMRRKYEQIAFLCTKIANSRITEIQGGEGL